MRANNKELIKKTAIITIGNASTKLISFLLLPFYTYILSTEEYGTYDLLHTYIYLLVPILSLQLDQAVFKLLVESRRCSEDQKTYVTTTTLFMVVQAGIHCLVFVIISRFWEYEYLTYMAGMIIATTLLYCTQQMVRGINKTGLYAAAGVISSSLGLLGNIVLLTKFDMRVDGLFLAGIISSSLATVFLWLTSGLHRYIDIKRFSKKTLKTELEFGIPLVPNELAWWVIHASDRTIVSFILGVAQNGIIAVSQKFSSAYITVYNIFNMSWTESVILHIKDDDGEEYISDTINKVTSLFFSIALGVIVIMPFVFSLFVNENYSQAYYLIPAYMIAGVVDICLGMISAVFVARSQTKYIASTTVLAAVINIVVHLVLISFIGVFAAPISTIVGYSTILIIRYRKIRKESRIRFSSASITQLVMLLAVSLILYYIQNKIICAVWLVICLLFCVKLNKPVLNVGWLAVKKKLSKK